MTALDERLEGLVIALVAIMLAPHLGSHIGPADIAKLRVDDMASNGHRSRRAQ